MSIDEITNAYYQYAPSMVNGLNPIAQAFFSKDNLANLFDETGRRVKQAVCSPFEVKITIDHKTFQSMLEIATLVEGAPTVQSGVKALNDIFMHNEVPKHVCGINDRLYYQKMVIWNDRSKYLERPIMIDERNQIEPLPTINYAMNDPKKRPYKCFLEQFNAYNRRLV